MNKNPPQKSHQPYDNVGLTRWNSKESSILKQYFLSAKGREGLATPHLRVQGIGSRRTPTNLTDPKEIVGPPIKDEDVDRDDQRFMEFGCLGVVNRAGKKDGLPSGKLT